MHVFARLGANLMVQLALILLPLVTAIDESCLQSDPLSLE